MSTHGGGRRKASIGELFRDCQHQNMKTLRVKCRYCETELAKNGTRMAKHIRQCDKTAECVKLKYLGADYKNNNKENIVTPSKSIIQVDCEEDDILMPWETRERPSDASKKALSEKTNNSNKTISKNAPNYHLPCNITVNNTLKLFFSSLVTIIYALRVQLRRF